MPDLEEAIRRLSASFANEVIAALRNVPLEELLALSADGGQRQDKRAPAAPARTRRTRGTSSPRSANEAVEIPSAAAVEGPSASALDEAERLFAERGSRGATVTQLADALAAEGVEAADVIRVLVERGSIRDAGFRRTTGKGTAPVFVSCR